MVTSQQRCVGQQLRGKHFGSPAKVRAAFTAAAKKCAKGKKVRAKYTRKYKKKGKKKYKRKGKKHRKAYKRKSTARRMKRVGTIVCRLK